RTPAARRTHRILRIQSRCSLPAASPRLLPLQRIVSLRCSHQPRLPMKNRPRLLLFLLGFLGILSLVPITTQLITAQPDAPAVPVWLIQLLSIVQPSLMLFLMVWL